MLVEVDDVALADPGSLPGISTMLFGKERFLSMRMAQLASELLTRAKQGFVDLEQFRATETNLELLAELEKVLKGMIVDADEAFYGAIKNGEQWAFKRVD